VRTLIVVVLLAVAAGCGSEVDVAIELRTSTLPQLAAFTDAVRRVRVTLRSEGGEEEAIFDRDAPLERLSVGFPSEEGSVEVEAFDAQGNVRAYGRTGVERLDEPVVVSVRRNLAYTIHLIGAGDRPESTVYAIDVVDRAVVERIRLPGSLPEAQSVTAWGGRALLFSVRDVNEGRVVIMSTDDHSFRDVVLSHIPDVALAPENGRVGIALGGGQLSFIDFEAGEVLEGGASVGGRVLDAGISPDGRRALVTVDLFPPGLVDVDLRRREVAGATVLQRPVGVAVDRDDGQAYVTSSEIRSVAAVDLPSGRSSPFSSSLVAPGGLAAYSSTMDGLVTVAEEGPVATVYAFGTLAGQSIAGSAVVFDEVTGLVTDGPGRRTVLVSAGGFEGDPGLTIMDHRFNEFPEVTSTVYPQDPEDRSGTDGPFRRYRPLGVAIPYGD
jgi:DNA-binding beta-propeller fold protein YncE